ncbi:MAG: outer membrane protein assembly factor BamA [Oligoflexia bacterium]|nr:outer membrane protein assembly factor BamA [Oligoflexia bacterium]
MEIESSRQRVRMVIQWCSRALVLIVLFFVYLFESTSLVLAVEKGIEKGTAKESEQLFKIDEVEIRGNRKIEKEAILEKILSKKGVTLDKRMLQSDIQTIYRMKYFDTVEAHQEIREGKNFLVWVLRERPIIKSISFSGNDDLSKDDLTEKIKSKEFSILDIHTVKSDIGELKKLYEEKGFYLASIDYEIKRIDEENAELIFKIKEYDKVRVKKITILGNRAFSDKELKEFMRTREETLLSFMNDTGSFRDFDFETDIERLKYFYKSKGYLQVNIGKPQVTVSEDKRWVFISFRITEGPSFSVNKIFFEGDLLFPEEKFREKIALKEGETYSEESLRKDIVLLTELYQDEGYAFANVIRNLQMVPGENKVDIHFAFEKGKIAYFGKIVMKGNTQTRDKVIRRELLVREGMKYSGSLLRQSKENVSRLGFFEAEAIVFNTVTVKDRDDVLDLEISIKEKNTGEFRFGAGYSTATAGFIQASVTKHNFRGLGQDLSATINWAKSTTEYRLGFTEPYLFDSKWTAGGDLYYRKEELRDYFTNEKGAESRIGYPIFDFTRLYLLYNLDYKKIRKKYVNGIALNPILDETLENGTASSLKLLLEYDKRNDRWSPTGGMLLRASFQYVGLGGSKMWSRSEVDGRYYYNIIDDLVFRTRATAAQIYRRNNKRVPRDDRLFLGGPRDLRGFDFQSIGPMITTTIKNEKNEDVEFTYNMGGLFTLYGSMELEYPLVKEAGVKWATFVDAGNIFEKYLGEKNNYGLRSDWGFGLRWFSPIGPLRFEWGFPLDRKPGEETQQFHFDIGQVF